MDKPKEAIERMREWSEVGSGGWYDDCAAILAYLDSIPSDAVPVVWPKELTREELIDLSRWTAHKPVTDALRALAAIAPQRKKRMVNLWERKGIGSWGTDDRMVNREYEMDGWRKVAGPIEIDE